MKEYTIILKKSGDQYVSLCLELTVVGCGDTKGEAIASVKDAIESYSDSMGDEAPADRPISLQLFHDFLPAGSIMKCNTWENSLKSRFTLLSY